MNEQTAILQAVLKAVPHAVGVYKILYAVNGSVDDFEVLVFNSLMVDSSGFSAEQVVGKRYGVLFPAAHQNGVFYRLKEVAEKDVTADFELSYEGEGTLRWRRFIAVKQHDLLVVTIEDITERKNAEIEFNESKGLLLGIIDAPNLGVSVFKAIRNENGDIENFRFEYVNRKTMEAFGSIDPIGTLITDYGSDGYEQMDYFIKAVETGKRNKYIRKAESGIVVGWFLLSNASLGNDRLVQVWEDVTEIKKAEQTIIQLKEDLAQESKDKYFSLFNAINEGFGIGEVIFDESGNGVDLRWSDLNPRFEKHTGLTLQEMLNGKTIRELIPDMELRWFEIIGNVVLTRQPIRYDGFATSLNRWYNCYAFPINDPNLNYVGILFQDVTESKKNEEALRESQARLAAELEHMTQLYELHTKLFAPVGLHDTQKPATLTGGFFCFYPSFLLLLHCLLTCNLSLSMPLLHSIHAMLPPSPHLSIQSSSPQQTFVLLLHFS